MALAIGVVAGCFLAAGCGRSSGTSAGGSGQSSGGGARQTSTLAAVYSQPFSCPVTDAQASTLLGFTVSGSGTSEAGYLSTCRFSDHPELTGIENSSNQSYLAFTQDRQSSTAAQRAGLKLACEVSDRGDLGRHAFEAVCNTTPPAVWIVFDRSDGPGAWLVAAQVRPSDHSEVGIEQMKAAVGKAVTHPAG